MRTYIVLLFAQLLLPLGAAAQQHDVTRTWLFGAGHNAVYDAYLSPLDYKGPTVSLTMLNERTARWGHERVSSMAMFDVNGSYTDNAAGNGHFIDGQLSLAMGWHYNWHPTSHLRLRLGGLAELSGGGTYNTRNGNNPAQGRAAFSIDASGILDYSFHSPFRRQSAPWTLRAQLDAPLTGLMFSPQYGQSYYELFELGHRDHNICATWPGNAPTVRLLTTVTIPIRRSLFIVGYKGDVRQSNVNALGRHAWNNAVVVGFSRNLSF